MLEQIREASSFCAAALLMMIVGVWQGSEAGDRSGNQVGSRSSARIIPGFVVFKSKVALPGGGESLLRAQIQTSLAQFGVYAVEPMFPGVRPPATQAVSQDVTDLSRISVASIPVDLDPVIVASNISRLSTIEYAEPRYAYPLLDVPNDSLLLQQDAYLGRVKAYQAWSLGKGDSSVVIATIDGGTYWQHEDLLPNLWINSAEDINHNGRFDPFPFPMGDEDGIDNDGNGFVDDVIGWNFTNNTNNPVGLVVQPDNSAHGTATASLFGSTTNNRKGLAGTSWNCRIMPICAASTTLDGHIALGIEGIYYAFMNGAKIINCSWGAFGQESSLMRDILKAAEAAGSLVVAAAGNDGADIDQNSFYPANDPHVLAVGATQSVDDAKAYFSNYGVGVPVYSPAMNIWGALKDGGYDNVGQGTSLASPLTAGLAGLIASAHRSWTPAQIRAQIRVTADPVDTVAANLPFAGRLGHGRVNFYRALAETLHSAIYVVSSLLHAGSNSTLYAGDTVGVSVTVRNVLFAPAVGVRFTLSSADTAVAVVQGSTSSLTLQPGEQTQLAEFTFRIRPLAESRTIVLRLAWTSDGSDADAVPLRFLALAQQPSWTLQGIPTGIGLSSVKAVSPTVAWAAGDDGTSSVILRTLDGGQHWATVTGTLSRMRMGNIDAVDTARAWVAGGGGTIFATTDGGKTWNAQTYGGTQAATVVGIRFLNASLGYILGNPQAGQNTFVLLRTSDGGQTWSHLPSEPVGSAGEKAGRNSFSWTDERHGWFGTNQSRIWRTANGGQSWNYSYPGLFIDPPSTARIFSVAFADSLRGIAYHPFPFLALSTDGGVTWSQSPVEPTSPQSEGGIAYPVGGRSAWRARDKSIYKSTNGGNSWSPESTYPVSGDITQISFVTSPMDSTLNVTGWSVSAAGEIFKRAYSVVSSVGIISSVSGPVSPRLFPSYPNPCNPSATITYELPKPSDVILTVYDILGREVSLLVNERRNAGFYEVKFDGSNLASGMYLYRLNAGSFVQTRKLLLLK
jgi:photosystem II stability/assembly factor-like uncharacterized protein